MKKIKFILPFAFMCSLLFSGCGTTGGGTPIEPDPVPQEEVQPRDYSEKLNIMLIGNSFTYFNDLNQPNGILAKIAMNAGYYNVTVNTIYHGGYYLHQYLDYSDDYGKQVQDALKSSTKYDIVIIQEQSSNALKNPGDFYYSCRELKKLIDGNGGQMYLYGTWGYKPGHAELPSLGPTTAEMEMKLRAAYTAIGEELDVPVIQAGAAMTKALNWYPELNLYKDDFYHPNNYGSHLVGWTMYGKIFRRDPGVLTFNDGLPQDVANKLRDVASSIFKNPPVVDDKYKTSSEGVVPEQVETVMLDKAPTAPLASIVYRDSKVTGDGWMTCKNDANKTFSGIRGDKDKIASIEYSDTKLNDTQKQDIADIGYGVSVIGIDHMDSGKKGTNFVDDKAGPFTSVGNLVNGHWGQSYMSAMFFDSNRYGVDGVVKEDGKYTSLITLNFGKVVNFDAIGYFSGNLLGFPQEQDVFVSSDGSNWTKVPEASYNASKIQLKSVDTNSLQDPWNGNVATSLAAFSMNSTSGKYIRVGVIRGGVIDGNTTGLEEINTRELVVYGA